MSEERSGRHKWVPIVAAIITSTAVVLAAYIGADARRQIESSKTINEGMGEAVRPAQEQLTSGEQPIPTDLVECRSTNRPSTLACAEGATPPSLFRENGAQDPTMPPAAALEIGEPSIPADWIRVVLAIPAGFQNGIVLVDGSPARVLERLPNYIDIQVPDAGRPITVRVEARGRICEQTMLPNPSGTWDICSEED